MTADPTGVDRERAVAMVRGAVNDGRIELQDAGRLLSSTYRARTRRELDRLVGDLAADRPARDVSDRAVYLRAAVRIALFAAAAALMLIAVLHSIDPLHPH